MPDRFKKDFTFLVVACAMSIIPLVFLVAQPSVSPILNLSHIILDGKDGSYADGRRWDSSILQGKITLLVYFDPDERDKGEIFMPTLEAFERDLDFSKFQTMLIVDLESTFIPGFLIKAAIRGQIKDHPKRNYIFDDKSVLVQNWGLVENEYSTLIINEKSKVIFYHTGKWEEGEILILDSLIRSLVGVD